MSNEITHQIENISDFNYQEDEIDLLELFNVIWINRYKIIIFTSIVFVLSIVYSMSLPNIYQSKTILIPQGESKSSVSQFSGIAALAGIDIGGDSGVSIDEQLKIIKDDYAFMKKLVIKHKIYDLITNDNLDKQYTFGLGIRFIYDVKTGIKFWQKNKHNELDDDYIYETVRGLKGLIKIDSDKKSNVITISVTHEVPYVAKKLVEIFLKEVSSHLRLIELENIDKKIGFYNAEVSKANELILKEQLTDLMSALIQKKVLLRASELYFLKQLTKPIVSNLKEKYSPRRSIMVFLSSFLGLFISVFGVFLIDYIRNIKNNQKDSDVENNLQATILRESFLEEANNDF